MLSPIISLNLQKVPGNRSGVKILIPPTKTVKRGRGLPTAIANGQYALRVTIALALVSWPWFRFLLVGISPWSWNILNRNMGAPIFHPDPSRMHMQIVVFLHTVHSIPEHCHGPVHNMHNRTNTSRDHSDNNKAKSLFIDIPAGSG